MSEHLKAVLLFLDRQWIVPNHLDRGPARRSLLSRLVVRMTVAEGRSTLTTLTEPGTTDLGKQSVKVSYGSRC